MGLGGWLCRGGDGWFLRILRIGGGWVGGWGCGWYFLLILRIGRANQNSLLDQEKVI